MATMRSASDKRTVMTSSFSLDEAKNQIYDNGFYVIEDSALGSSFEEMLERQSQFSFSTDTGFKFCHDFILLDPRIKGIVDAFGSDVGSRYLLAYCGGFPADPHHIFSLRDGGDKPGILIVQAWPKGSRSTYYCTSHNKRIPRLRSANKFLEVPEKQLEAKGCFGKELGRQDELQDRPSLAEGGLVVFDARLAFRSKEKWSYFYCFVEEALLEGWKQQKRTFWLEGLLPPPSQDSDRVASLGVDVRRG